MLALPMPTKFDDSEAIVRKTRIERISTFNSPDISSP